jgi:hypothetical protein
MGNPPQKQLAPLQIGRQAPGYWKPLSINAFTCCASLSALRVYARKRISLMPDTRISKLLIQSALTLVNQMQATFTNSNPFWG